MKPCEEFHDTLCWGMIYYNICIQKSIGVNKFEHTEYGADQGPLPWQGVLIVQIAGAVQCGKSHWYSDQLIIPYIYFLHLQFWLHCLFFLPHRHPHRTPNYIVGRLHFISSYINNSFLFFSHMPLSSFTSVTKTSPNEIIQENQNLSEWEFTCFVTFLIDIISHGGKQS